MKSLGRIGGLKPCNRFGSVSSVGRAPARLCGERLGSVPAAEGEAAVDEGVVLGVEIELRFGGVRGAGLVVGDDQGFVAHKGGFGGGIAFVLRRGDVVDRVSGVAMPIAANDELRVES